VECGGVVVGCWGEGLMLTSEMSWRYRGELVFNVYVALRLGT